MFGYYIFYCFGQMRGDSVCDVVVFHSCGLDSFRYGLMRGGVRFSQRQLFTPVTQSNLLSLLVLLHFYVFYRSLVTGATYLKKSVSCLNTYVWHHIPTLTMLYDQAPTGNGYTRNWSICAVVTCVARILTSAFYMCNGPNISVAVGG